MGQNDVERLFGMRIAASVSTDRTAAGNTAGNAAQPDKKDRTEQTVVASLAPARDRDATGVSMQSTASLAGGVVQSSVMMVPNTPELPSPPLVVPPVTSPEVLPPVTPPVVVQLPTQLVWGKFSNPQKLPFTLPVAYADVKDGRHTTVGELGQYVLWRDGVNGPLDKSLRGQAQFALAAGEAFYQQAGKTLAVNLTDPRLQVDFDRLSFNTQIGLSGAGVPAQQLNVSGRMNDEGVFLGTASGQRVAGALSRNGVEAGYLFKIDNSAGQYQGITLWNAK